MMSSFFQSHSKEVKEEQTTGFNSSDDDGIMFKQLEKELVERVCTACYRIIMIGSTLASLAQFRSGVDQAKVANPAIVVLFGLLSNLFSNRASTQGATVLIALGFAAFRHAIFYQGCSACQVPFIFGCFPCASGFLFRTRRAVFVTAFGVLALVSTIYAIDLSGNCPSDPIDPSDKHTIIADRLIPIVALILVNTTVLTVILRQSQDSLLRHAEAARSAGNLANLRKDLLHRVTHELRTPLNGLVGSVELLTVSETIHNSTNDMENVMTIKRCLTSILGICDNVLVAAKLSDQDALIKEEKPFVLASCIDDVVEIFASAVQAKGVELKLEYDGDTRAVVRGLEIKLQQVLLNLIGNAVKFTDSGSITIQVRIEETENGMLLCTFGVKDTGVGIDAKDAEMLFEPFHQGEQGAVSRRHKGTGLGLTISRDLVQQMGGKIVVDGAPGQGSRFQFSLLLRKELQEQTVDVIGDTYDESTTPCEIMIADPEPACLKSFRSLAKSVAPPLVSTNITTVDSHVSLLDLIRKRETQANYQSAAIRRIAIVKYDRTDKAFASALSIIRKSGWLVIVHSNWGEFAETMEKSADAYAVFRRPLPLVRMGKCLREALTGVPPKSPEDAKGIEDRDHAPIKPQTPIPKSPSPYSKGSVIKSASSTDLVRLSPNTKLVVVDDTHVNVKVLVKMLSRSTSAPIVPLYDGESAIQLAESSQPNDVLLYLMDWHMPGICGLTATESIRKRVKERGGPRVHVCMLTANIEGMLPELEQRSLTYGGIISNTGFARQKDVSRNKELALIDAVAGKPVTFQSIQAILRLFQEQVDSDAVGMYVQSK